MNTQKRYQRNKEAGWCVVGGEKHGPPEEGKTLCTACLLKKRARTKANRQQQNECRRKRYKLKLEKGLCVTDGCNLPATHAKKCEKHCMIGRARDIRKAKALKDETFEKYGGYRCHCPGCTVDKPEFIQLDHINNDGAKHRREIAPSGRVTSSRMYRWLKNNNWPPIMQPLCANCNSAKGVRGKCPYEGQPH